MCGKIKSFGLLNRRKAPKKKIPEKSHFFCIVTMAKPEIRVNKKSRMICFFWSEDFSSSGSASVQEFYNLLIFDTLREKSNQIKSNELKSNQSNLFKVEEFFLSILFFISCVAFCIFFDGCVFPQTWGIKKLMACEKYIFFSISWAQCAQRILRSFFGFGGK